MILLGFTYNGEYLCAVIDCQTIKTNSHENTQGKDTEKTLQMKEITIFERLITEGINNDTDRELLANSLFYFCCGSDPTPIAAFGDKHPIYVYVDVNTSFVDMTQKLYKCLKKLDFKKESVACFGEFGKESPDGKPIVKQAELTKWHKQGQEDFLLFFVQGDARVVYKVLYGDKKNGNYIMPKCVCNQRYEIQSSSEVRNDDIMPCNSLGLLNQIMKRVEFVMGHNNNPEKYKKVGEYKYYGDYGGDTVSLYKRMYYYLY